MTTTLSAANVTWDAADYAANSAPQQAWARELIAKLRLRGNEHILDVGCGDGKVTAELARVVPRGAIIGIDASPHMVDFARETFPTGNVANLSFQVMDARQIHFNRSFDLIFSNAALHWVNDHQAFLRGAASALIPGGRLVVSCGGKGNARDVFEAFCPEMRRRPWRDYFRRLEVPYFFHSPADYEAWLPRCSFEIREVKLAPKDAVYENRDDFAAWLRTTWLPYTQRVPEDLREQFIDRVVDNYLGKHPLDDQGRVHVRMVRLEIDALKRS